MTSSATFYTVSDAAFFPGTVALLNSLRLTGNPEPLVVLDNGLTPRQRARLERHAQIVDLPASKAQNPLTLKPFPLLFGAPGTVALIDSDMIVSASLGSILARAGEGPICMFPDSLGDQGRWFAEWEELFSLSKPPRHQTYLNAGFVAFSINHWPRLLEDWWKACSLIPAHRIFDGKNQPFRDGDQDALNAILMAEFDEDAVNMLPYYGEAHPPSEFIHVVDEEHLVVMHYQTQVSILHHSGRPKVWNSSGFRRLRFPEPYIQLFPRVAFARDVPLRLAPSEVPWWLGPGWPRRLAVRVVKRAKHAATLAAGRARRLRARFASSRP